MAWFGSAKLTVGLNLKDLFQPQWLYDSVLSRKLTPPLPLHGLFCYSQPRLGWGQAGNPFMGHQPILHSICLTTGNSTQTSQFIRSLATVLSMPTVKSVHTDRGRLWRAKRANILLSSSPFSIGVFSSPTPRDGSPLQSRNPLDEQNKPTRQHILQPRSRKFAGLWQKGT